MPFYGSTADDAEAARAIESAGLEVVAESRLGKAVAGPPSAFEELTGGTLTTVERLMHTRVGRVQYVTHLDIVGDGQPEALGVGAAGPAAIEGVSWNGRGRRWRSSRLRSRRPLRVFTFGSRMTLRRFWARRMRTGAGSGARG